MTWLRCQECSQICLLKNIESKKLLVEVSICQNVLGLLIMRCLVKTCSQTVQVTSALQRMFPLTLYFDIHSINVSMYLCNCNQITSVMCIPHITWTVYLHIMIRTVHIYLYCYLYMYTVYIQYLYHTGMRDDDVNGKPTVFKSNQNDEFLYLCSFRPALGLLMASLSTVFHSPPCFCLQQVYINQGVGQAHVHTISYSKIGP